MTTQSPSSKKKICYLAPDVAIPSPRGSTVHVVELAENLSALGHEVHVICRRLKGQSKTEQIDGFTVHRIYRWIVRRESRSSFSQGSATTSSSPLTGRIYYFYLLTIFRLYAAIIASRVIAKHKLDEIIERETSFGAGGLASILSRKPMILEIVGPRYSRISAWRSSSVLYYTESMLRKWVDRRKCVPVPAGVNLELFSQDGSAGRQLRQKQDFHADTIVVGYVGTFQNWHGVDTLISAAQELHAEWPNLRLLLVGPYFQKCEALANEKQVADMCVFMGAVDYRDVPSYVYACDIMVALYNPDVDPLRKKYGIGWPIKILEYMACGKPVISTTVPPIDQIITNEEIGIMIRPGDVAELTKALELLFTDRDKRTRMGINGRSLVESKYSWSAIAQTISSLIQR